MMLVLVAFSMNLFGCANRGEVKNEASSAIVVKYSFVFEPTGLPKYDNFFKSTKDLSDQLDQADYAINHIVPAFKSAFDSVLKAVQSTAAIPETLNDLPGLFKLLGENLKNAHVILYVDYDEKANLMVLKVKAETGFDVKMELIDNITAALNDINTLLNYLTDAPRKLASAADTSISLAKQANALVNSAKADFTGMNAMKLPGCVDSLNKAIPILSGVPDKVKKVLDASIRMVADVKGLI